MMCVPLGGSPVCCERLATPMPKYHEAFKDGEVVQVVGPEALLTFQREWLYHHPLQERQLHYAGKTCKVQSLSFYHGGACIYELETSVRDDPPSRFWHQETVPGFWHEQCLTDRASIYWDQRSASYGSYCSSLAADAYVIASETRGNQTFVVVRSTEGSEFLAFRHSQSENEARVMREVDSIRNTISFEDRYGFHGIGHEILKNKLAETKLSTGL